MPEEREVKVYERGTLQEDTKCTIYLFILGKFFVEREEGSKK